MFYGFADDKMCPMTLMVGWFSSSRDDFRKSVINFVTFWFWHIWSIMLSSSFSMRYWIEYTTSIRACDCYSVSRKAYTMYRSLCFYSGESYLTKLFYYLKSVRERFLTHQIIFSRSLSRSDPFLVYVLTISLVRPSITSVYERTMFLNWVLSPAVLAKIQMIWSIIYKSSETKTLLKKSIIWYSTLKIISMS